jgi:hypothetical protein
MDKTFHWTQSDYFPDLLHNAKTSVLALEYLGMIFFKKE